MSQALKRTPLFDRHVEAGARMAPFAGFEMPVVYSGIIDEHRAVRSRAGLFDVSHMGELRLRGPDALALAQRLFTNDVAGTAPGRVRYGMVCQEDGGTLDDVTLYREADDELLFCVNASNIAADLDWFRSQAAGLDCELSDESDATALLALQGPAACEIVAPLLPEGFRRPRRFRFAPTELDGIPVVLSRTGYTGEDGYEIYAPVERAVALWDRLLAAGGERLVPAGLGARDTLRTEMGYPLYGHELDRSRNPIEAGLARFVAFGRGFTGEAALLRARDRAGERLVGLLLEGRQVARPGYPILVDGSKGSVTSGTFGPSVERCIAMGYVPAEFAHRGTRLHVEIRGRALPCVVSELPFYARNEP